MSDQLRDEYYLESHGDFPFRLHYVLAQGGIPIFHGGDHELATGICAMLNRAFRIGYLTALAVLEVEGERE